jgi:hypothetical protein
MRRWRQHASVGMMGSQAHASCHPRKLLRNPWGEPPLLQISANSQRKEARMHRTPPLQSQRALQARAEALGRHARHGAVSRNAGPPHRPRSRPRFAQPTSARAAPPQRTSAFGAWLRAQPLSRAPRFGRAPSNPEPVLEFPAERPKGLHLKTTNNICSDVCIAHGSPCASVSAKREFSEAGHNAAAQCIRARAGGIEQANFLTHLHT